MMNTLRICLLRITLICTLFGIGQAQAFAVATSFYLDWSGAMWGNGAEAHGILTIDDAVFPRSTTASTWLTPGEDIIDFSLTVSGAGSGNGHFQFSDYEFFVWSTQTDTEFLDLSRELVGQATMGGGWGSDFGYEGSAGDFNILAVENSGAPTMFGTFQIASNGGFGDNMGLISFRPVPLPASFWLFGSALAGLIPMVRKQTVAA